MKTRSIYNFLFIAFIATVISACSVGNKAIPNPGGVIGVDTSNTTLNKFQIIVTGDTSFVMNITAIDTLNSLVDDSLGVAGIEMDGNKLAGLVGFKTYSSAPGTYLTELTPPGITSAEFGIIKVINGVRRIFVMPHGKIIISEHNIAAKEVKGSFDVNNEFVSEATKTLRCRGSFYIKYK